VWLTAEDIARLAAALELTEADFIADWTELTRNRAGLSLRTAADGDCVLLRDGRVCRAYAARPAQCREFPARWTVAAGCPGQTAAPGGGA